MEEKTADIDILEKMFFDDETFEPIGYIETNFTKEQQQAIKNIIAENKKLERQIKIKNAYLILINDIAYDYDGCNTVESLKELIDELVKMNTQALKNDDWTVMYTDLSQTKNRNILQELLDERSNTDD